MSAVADTPIVAASTAAVERVIAEDIVAAVEPSTAAVDAVTASIVIWHTA